MYLRLEHMPSEMSRQSISRTRAVGTKALSGRCAAAATAACVNHTQQAAGGQAQQQQQHQQRTLSHFLQPTAILPSYCTLVHAYSKPKPYAGTRHISTCRQRSTMAHNVIMHTLTLTSMLKTQNQGLLKLQHTWVGCHCLPLFGLDPLLQAHAVWHPPLPATPAQAPPHAAAVHGPPAPAVPALPRQQHAVCQQQPVLQQYQPPPAPSQLQVNMHTMHGRASLEATHQQVCSQNALVKHGLAFMHGQPRFLGSM